MRKTSVVIPNENHVKSQDINVENKIIIDLSLEKLIHRT